MAIRTLVESPSLGGLYARAAAASLPGARLLGRGSAAGGPDRPVALPDLELRLTGIGIDAGHLRRYSEVCGFGRSGGVPATYPHVLAFPLHLAVMTEPGFPFPVMGLVHIGNRIEQRRPLTATDTFDLHVRAEDLRPHARGTQLTLVSEALVDGDVVWRDETVVLRRRGGAATADRSGTATGEDLPRLAPRGPIRWRLDRSLGRRYAAVSGDRNPVHLSALSARPFGFPAAIAHGMRTKAKSLATLAHLVPDAFTIEVAFRKPILLPGEVSFGARGSDGGLGSERAAIVFGVTSGDFEGISGEVEHASGEVEDTSGGAEAATVEVERASGRTRTHLVGRLVPR